MQASRLPASPAEVVTTAALVLAAGRGTRFPGVASKVLVCLAGKPLVEHVISNARAAGVGRVVVVVGHGKEAVMAAVATARVETVDQGVPRGTGHAVLAAASVLEGAGGRLLVLNGDVPLLGPVTLRRLLARLDDGAAAAIVTATLAEPGAYGRVLRSATGAVAAIVEAADATPEQLAGGEINVGAYAFHGSTVFALLRQLAPDNAQGEIYLTDAVRRLVERGERVDAVEVERAEEARGINTPEELQILERALAGC